MSKPKKVVRSKDQLIAELKQKKEVTRQRLLVKEELVPLLLKHSKNIEHAKFLCDLMANALKNAADALVYKEQMRISTEHISTLSTNIMESIDRMKAGDTGPDKMISDPAVNDLMFLFRNETISTMDVLVRSLSKEIDASIKEECLGRPLETLKITLL